MSGRQWGNTDNSSNSVLWGVVYGHKTANASNRNAFYDNTTPNAYINNLTLGQFAVTPQEMQVYDGPVDQVNITNLGSGYSGTTYSTIGTGSGGTGSGANVTFAASSTGRLSSYTINNGGTAYKGDMVSVTINAPAPISFNGNTAVSGNNISIATANSYFQVNDYITFTANATSLPGGLANGTSYYVALANTTVVQLSTYAGGPAIALTPASGNSTTAAAASLTGQTATAVAETGGALHKGVTHAGWVIRKVGTGGRAGRVQYETLVAFGSMGPSTANSAYFPNAN